MILVGPLAVDPSGIAVGMLMTDQPPGTLGWISSMCYGIGILLMLLGNSMRIRATVKTPDATRLSLPQVGGYVAKLNLTKSDYGLAVLARAPEPDGQ